MNILITGVSGFIGNYLADMLSKDGNCIIGIYRDQNKIENLINNSNIKLIKSDIGFDIQYNENVDVIIHAAAQSPYNCLKVMDYVKSNVIGTYNVVEYAKRMKVSKLIYLSSISIYGQVQKRIVDEDTEIIDPDNYGVTKYLGEQILKDNESIINSVALRLPGVIGQNAKTPWLAQVIQKAKNNEDIIIYNSNSLFNNAVYLSDLFSVIKDILKFNLTGFDIFNLASSESISIKEVVTLVIQKLKSKSMIIEKENNKTSFVISYEKAEKKFNYKPITIIELLDKYINMQEFQ